MTMIQGSGTISDYGSFISNCTKNQLSYKIPVNTLADVQLYINIGTVKPVAASYELIHTCGDTYGTVEAITPSDYVIGQDVDNNWYGVFKNFSGSAPVCFVIAITLDSQIFFSEEYCIETSCIGELIEIQGCYGNLDSLLSYDCEGVYFGYHAGSGSALGDTTVRYEHKLLLREVEVVIGLIKNTFKQGLIRNFRTEKQKIFQFYGELIPEWYLAEIDAVFYRGEVFIDGVKYLVEETQFEKIDGCKKIWKIPATLREYCYKSFSCEEDACAPPATECCDPEIIDVTVEQMPEEEVDSVIDSGIEDSGETVSEFIVVVQAVVDRTPNVTGTFEPVTGIVSGSSIVTSDAFVNRRVYIERGHIHNPGIDPEDGSLWHTKNLLDNYITFSHPLMGGEFIYIETIPSFIEGLS